MDYTDIRKLAIEFSGLSGMDDTYTFYYDETNNSRKFRITEKDFNSSKDEDFVIGGLVYEGENRQFSLDKLFQSFKLQSNVKEIKRQHIAPGKTFLECVKSPKLQLLLKWIIENEVYVHFMAMNNLYFGMIDESLVLSCQRDRQRTDKADAVKFVSLFLPSSLNPPVLMFYDISSFVDCLRLLLKGGKHFSYRGQLFP